MNKYSNTSNTYDLNWHALLWPHGGSNVQRIEHSFKTDYSHRVMMKTTCDKREKKWNKTIREEWCTWKYMLYYSGGNAPEYYDGFMGFNLPSKPQTSEMLWLCVRVWREIWRVIILPWFSSNFSQDNNVSQTTQMEHSTQTMGKVNVKLKSVSNQTEGLLDFYSNLNTACSPVHMYNLSATFNGGASRRSFITF